MSDNPEIQKLQRQIDDTNLRVFAMQTLLQQRALLRSETVDARILELREICGSRLEKPQENQVEKQASEDLWKLLGEYGGQEQ